MPKKVSESEIEAILEAVKQFPNGGSAEEIEKILDGQYSRRTFRRRLASLLEDDRLAVNGQGKATRYYVPKTEEGVSAAEVNDEPELQEKSKIQISRESILIRRDVQEPIQARKPVGYEKKFLDDYIPNKTNYLSTEVRRHLAELGKAPEENLPAGTYIRHILDRLLIDLSWNSSRLEGNTYSRLDTEVLLKYGKQSAGKNTEEAQMILNHKASIEFLVENAADPDMNRSTILNLHSLLSENLLSDPAACGRLRTNAVTIGQSTYHPLEVPQLIEDNFEIILEKARIIEDPFEQAFFIMVQIPYLQPFDDVNKRVSRLAANLPLIRHNLCPLSFIDVPKSDYIEGVLAVYELNRFELLRDVFVWAYERSCSRYSAVRQSLGEPDAFRLRNRGEIKQVVGEVVRDQLGKPAAADFVKRRAISNISEEDRERFIEVVETELLSLHEGNIARYRLRPSEFSTWQKNWNQ